MRDLAPSFRFLEGLVRLPDHNYFVPSELLRSSEPCGPHFPRSPVVTFRCKSFLVPSKTSSCPVASRDPLPVLLMVLVYSLLLEDLSSVELKILQISLNARGSSEFFGVEIRDILWKICNCVSCTLFCAIGLAELEIAPALRDVHVDNTLWRPDPVVFLWIAGLPFDAAEVDAPCCS